MKTTKKQTKETLPQVEVIKKRQFELSDTDFEFLNKHHYSSEAWESIGRKHGIDPETREPIPNTHNRAFLGMPKKYAPPQPVTGKVTTLKGMNDPLVPIHSSQVDAELRKRNLTLPTSDETHEEEI